VTVNTLCNISSFVDVMFADNRSGKADAYRVYTESDSPGSKSDVCDCLVDICVVNLVK